jgi:hypothetical protein
MLEAFLHLIPDHMQLYDRLTELESRGKLERISMRCFDRLIVNLCRKSHCGFWSIIRAPEKILQEIRYQAERLYNELYPFPYEIGKASENCENQ